MMMRSTLMFEAGNSPPSLLHLTARYWHRSSFHWWPHLEYRVIQLGWMITRAISSCFHLFHLLHLQCQLYLFIGMSLFTWRLWCLQTIKTSIFPERSDYCIGTQPQTKDIGGVLKKVAKRMLLKPRCTRSITSSRSPLTNGRFLLRLSRIKRS